MFVFRVMQKEKLNCNVNMGNVDRNLKTKTKGYPTHK